ncbi:MAG: hypothetical protein J7K00_00555 [Candidatus Diapherotrites archaeon]|nr:hypothetical protein [Candidatus Diapherotrites archaeon]
MSMLKNFKALKSFKVIFLMVLLLFSVTVIAVKGLEFGIDFKGGTMFKMHFEKALTPEQMNEVKSTLEQRLNWSGLMDLDVKPWGDEYVLINIAETDPEKVEKIESVLSKQGKFETAFNGKVIYDGKSIMDMPSGVQSGYGIKQGGNLFVATLPFSIDFDAAKAFAEAAYHTCEHAGMGSDGKPVYDCPSIFLFLDRPKDAVLVMGEELFETESITYSVPGSESTEVLIDDIKENSESEIVVIEDTDANVSAEILSELEMLFEDGRTLAVVPEGTSENVTDSLAEIGYDVREVPKTGEYWLWDATGLKSVMSIGEGLANMSQKDKSSMQVYQKLVITMTNSTLEGANQELDSMRILLKSGSLPLRVESIDKDVISPALGREFLSNAMVAGIAAILAVAFVLFLRYRRIILTIPMMFTALSEVVIIMGFAALTGWNLDLAAIAGIIAAVGTGVDDQIVITDELMRGERKTGVRSILGKVKNAFFIIFAAASTTIAAMFPIVFIGLGMGKLVGFATVTIFGVLAGVFVTRPAFAEIMKEVAYNELFRRGEKPAEVEVSKKPAEVEVSKKPAEDDDEAVEDDKAGKESSEKQ